MASSIACPESVADRERVLVLAPVGRDAQVLCQMLDQAGLASVACGGMDELVRCLSEGAGALVLTEEALVPKAASDLVSDLVMALSAQPSWSDVPVVLLAGGEPLLHGNAQTIAVLSSSGTVTVLERPVRGLTLMTAVQAALRARRRQYEICDLIQSEQEARRIAEAACGAAETASRLKDEFLATVSHELRTPLGAILLWIRLLSKGRMDSQKTQRALQAVERSAEAQSHLIEDLLDVARMTSGKLRLNLRDADLMPIVRAAVDVVRPIAEAKRIRLESTLDATVYPMRCDPDRIQQVVWNLLNNAVKFTSPGGSVSLSVQRDGAHVRIEVADTGKGISPQFLPYVFERFRQADATTQRSQSGLGIGLAVSRQLVELHGGAIRAESPGEGLGAVFTVELPLGAASGTAQIGAASPPDGGAAEAGHPLAGVRVLLVEDDPNTREAMVCTLRDFGAEVTAVGSATAALDALSAVSLDSRPHVLLSDLALPGMDGYELLRRVRAMEGARSEPAIPAAVVTAYVRLKDRTRALEVGFSAHVPKPVEPDQLAAVVAQLAHMSR